MTDQIPAYFILSYRQRQVTKLLAEGSSVKEIASFLGTGTSTIEEARTKSLAKLGITSLASLTQWALQAKLAAPILFTAKAQALPPTLKPRLKRHYVRSATQGYE